MQKNKKALQSPNLTRQSKLDSKDKTLILQGVRNKVEKGTGLPIAELKAIYSEEELFNISLQHLVTTKKTLCVAMGIPVEAGCRYKRALEKESLLVQSKEKVYCPYTNHKAYLITTIPSKLHKWWIGLESINQTKLDF